VDERAVALAELTLRRALASLDGIAVPTLSVLSARRRSLPRWRALFAPLVTAALVLVAALALGDALAAWRADRSSTGASAGSPTASTRATASPVASETVSLPTDCPADTTPELRIDTYPQGGEHGGTTPAAAFTATYPAAGAFTTYKFGPTPGAPTWIVSGGRTFIATVLPDGSWFVSTATFVRCKPLPAQRYLDVDGYRFVVTVVTDPAYGPNATAAYAVSAVSGVGIRCEWSRTGPDLSRAADLFGTTDSVVQTAAYAPVTRDTRSDRTNGIPSAAVHGQTASLVCGVDDDTGRHGVAIDLSVAPDGFYTARSLALSRWSGGAP
jgi:hypothetical protein